MLVFVNSFLTLIVIPIVIGLWSGIIVARCCSFSTAKNRATSLLSRIEYMNGSILNKEYFSHAMIEISYLAQDMFRMGHKKAGHALLAIFQDLSTLQIEKSVDGDFIDHFQKRSGDVRPNMISIIFNGRL